MAEYEPHAEEDQPEGPPRGRRRLRVARGLRYVLYAVAGLVGLLVVTAVTVLLLLQTPWGADKAKNIVVDQLNPLFQEGAHLRVDSLSGNFINQLTLYDVNFLNREGERMAHADTAGLEYSLWRILIRQRIVIRNVYLAGPDAHVTQEPDGTWDLINALPAADTTVEARRSAFAFQIDEFTGRNGSAWASFYSAESDSTILRAGDLNWRTTELDSDVITVNVDTVWGHFTPPGAPDQVNVRGSGLVGDSVLAVQGLRLFSSRSDLFAQGTLRRPETWDETLEDIDFTLRARPVAFRDLTPFVPNINREGYATVDADIQGTSRLLDAQIDARFGNGSSVALQGEITPQVEGRVRYHMDATVRRLVPGYFTTGGPATTSLNADAHVDLRGHDVDSLNGLVRGRVFDSQIGQQEILEASVRSTFEDGRANFSADGALRGARLDLEGTGRLFDDVPTYAANGSFNDVDLGALLQNPEQSSDLNGTFSLEGQGYDPETADLTAQLSFGPSVLNGRAVERGTATLRLQNGDLTFDGEFILAGGQITLAGSGRFENGTVVYNIRRGRLQNFNLAAFTGNPAHASDLTGTFTAEGEGTSLDNISLTAQLNLAASQFGDYRINRANFGLSLQNRDLAAGGQLDLVGGSFDVTLSGRFFEDVPTYDLEGHFSNVDLGELLQNPQQSSNLNGRFSLQGSGFDPETANVTGSFRLYDSMLNETRIERGTADLTLRSGDLAFDVDFATPAGGVIAEGTGTFRQGTFSYNIRQGRLQNFDISLLTGDPQTTSDITGSFTATGRGTDLSTLTLEAQINLEPSRFNQQQIERGTVSLDLQRGDLNFRADVLTPEGRVLFTGSGNLLDTPTFALQEGSFEGLNLGAFLNQPGLRTRLTGTIEFTGRGDLQSGIFDAVIRLQRSTVNDAVIQSGRIAANVRQGRADLDAQLQLPEGSTDFVASINYGAAVPRYQASGSVTNLDLAAVTGVDTLQSRVSFDFEVEGAGTNPETMQLAGWVRTDSASFRTATVNELDATFALDDGLLTVDTLQLESNFATATGSGQIALFDPDGLLQSNFNFVADVTSLQPIRPFLPVENISVNQAHIEGRAFGPAGTLRFEGSTNMRNLVYDDIRVADLQARFTGEMASDRTLQIGELRAQAGYLSLPQITVENTQITAVYEDDTAVVNLDMRLDPRRDLQLTGTFDLSPQGRRLLIDNLIVNLDDDQWQLLQPATIAYDGAIRISNLLLYSDDQQIAVDGILDPMGEQNLVFTVENFRIGSVADLLGLQQLEGRMSGSVNLTGPATAPIAEGDLVVDLESYEEDAGRLLLGLNYANQQLDVDATMMHEDESALEITGYVPLDLRLAPDDSLQIAGGPGITMETGPIVPNGEVNLSVQADSFAVDWVRPFLDPERAQDLQGWLMADVDITGTFESPILDGSAMYRGGRVTLPNYGVTYTDIRADMDFRQNQMVLRNLLVRSGDGEVTGQGTIDLPQLTLGEFNIDLFMDNFYAVDTREYRAVTSGNMTLRGTTREPVLRGNVNVMSADIHTDEMNQANLEDVALTEQDVQMLERNFGMRLSERDTTRLDFYEALDMGLNVELERDVWIRSRTNPEMNIQFTGNLDVSKEPYSEEQVFGTIDVIEQRSYIEIVGRRFDITSGTLRFNGPPTDPVLDLEAALPVPSQESPRQAAANITLRIEGPLDNPEVALGSDEQLGASNIISYLATGQPAGESLQLSGLGTGTLIGSGTNLAFSQLTSLIEGAAAEGLGLDIVQIQAGGPLGTYLAAGKYVTNRLYVGIEQPLSNAPNYWGWSYVDQTRRTTQVTVEYELFDWLLARLAQRGSLLQVDLFWEYSY